MPIIPFPMSSAPGRRAGEGEGRLVNAYWEKVGETPVCRRTPGLSVVAGPGRSLPRGMIEVNGSVYAVYANGVVKVTGGVVTVLAGSIPGTDGVTLARNNRVAAGVSSPDIVAVRESGGAYVVSDAGVAAYPDQDLPATVNSVTFQDGFFVFGIRDGRIFASELNSTDVNALSFTTAESRPDGLVRCISHAGVVYAMGTNTIEPHLNVGASPFPLQRGTSAIPVGLLTAMAVAGFELGWDNDPYFVSHDRTVQALRGYRPERVSTPDVESFIAASTTSALEACVYTASGNAFWVLSSDRGTWELNVTTGQWHERVSAGANRWRGSRSLKRGHDWLVGDTLSANLLKVDDTIRTEAGAAVTWTVESSPLKDYPARIAVPSLVGDFTRADASVLVSWSHDGGRTWADPLTRSLARTDRFPVCVNRLGLSTHHGVRARYSTATTADFSFMGASVPGPQGRAP